MPLAPGSYLGRMKFAFIGRLWLVTFMHYDLWYFDDEAGRVEPIADSFGSKVLPMCSE